MTSGNSEPVLCCILAAPLSTRAGRDMGGCCSSAHSTGLASQQVAVQPQRAKGEDSSSLLHCSTVRHPYGIQWGPGIKHSAGEPLLGDSVQRGHPDDMHSEQRCSQARHGPGNPTVALNSSIPFPCSGLVRTSNYLSLLEWPCQLSPALNGQKQGNEKGRRWGKWKNPFSIGNHSFRFMPAPKGWNRSQNPTSSLTSNDFVPLQRLKLSLLCVLDFN